VVRHRVAGTVEILPSQRPEVKDVVTSYTVVLEDAFGNRASELSWSAVAPADNSATILVPIESMELPATATQLVVRAHSVVGESATSTSTNIDDIVRSAPLSVTFSGDVNPLEGVISGNFTIQPAVDQTGISAYAIYFANGTKDKKLLGHVAAPLAGNKTSQLRRAPYEAGLGLLVVSKYQDGSEMEDGAYADVTDWVCSGCQERRLSIHQTEIEQDIAEPWLRRPRQPSWNEIQTLWTAQPLARNAGVLPMLQASRGGRPASDNLKLLGSMTIPGLLRSLSRVTDSEEEPVYMPMAAEERIHLRDGLAEALPGVGSEQIKLTRGQALKGDAAAAGIVPATGAGRRLSSAIEKSFEQNAASLVVDFEVIPPAALTDIAGEQAFLDRVEAQLILLSQGGSATVRLDAILTERLQRAGTILPQGGLHTLMSEPRQVAPKKQLAPTMAIGRHLAEDSLGNAPEAITDDEDEETQDVTQASLAATAAAVLSALVAVGSMMAAMLRKRGRPQREREANALEGVSVSDQ